MAAANLIRFPSRRRAREEAALWIARLDRGLKADERAELGRWAAEPVNLRALRELATLWDRMTCLGELAGLFPLRTPAVNLRRPEVRIGLVATAASLLLCVVTTSLWFWQQRQNESASAVASAPDSVPAWTTEVTTGIGDSQTVTLPDGSTVTANTDTRIAIRIGAGARDLTLLRGEAFFTVAPDAQRPFRVQAGGRVVQAIGTAFNVRLREAATVEVTVTEGKVRVTAVSNPASGAPARAGAETLVSANQALLAAPDHTAVREIDALVRDQTLAWQYGMLLFQGEPLEQMLAEVSRYTGTQFVIPDVALRQLRVAGYFRAGDVAGVLQALERNFAIKNTLDAEGRVVLATR
ncbi:MAG: FecR domain-containing protein [Gammaproteobacteria bacterium]|nr:FecR domain-containing protein [Gammaproteobacteria bacterium]